MPALFTVKVSRIDTDDVRDYYVKDLALTRIEWEDSDNDRTMNLNDLLYFHFNKSVWVEGGIAAGDFVVYENNEATTSVSLDITFNLGDNPGYTNSQATETALICRVGGGNQVKLGVHSLAFDDSLAILRKYREVIYKRGMPAGTLETAVKTNTLGDPLRYAIRTNPIKITAK